MSLPNEDTLKSLNDLNSFLVPLGNSGVTPPGQQMNSNSSRTPEQKEKSVEMILRLAPHLRGFSKQIETIVEFPKEIEFLAKLYKQIEDLLINKKEEQK